MKILYGVQGTGNGHITRARLMAKALADVGVKVDWVFSGRERKDFFDMEIFGEFRSFRGLTFATRSGKVLYWQTAMSSNLPRLWKDICSLNLDGYDLVITDFEPVSAWAGRRAGQKVIGISHQNAFRYDIPKQGNNPIIEWFIRNFAPVTLPIGLHWHHFDQPILPPMVEHSSYENTVAPRHYLVYLPFAGLDDIVPQLRQFRDYEFFVYQPVPAAYDLEHIHIRPFSRDGFQRELHRCEGVICSSGFELPSEAIHLGKKLLVQPVAGQMEQKSNALALQQLGYGSVAKELSVEAIAEWLPRPMPRPKNYPDVAKALANWLVTTGGMNIEPLLHELWSDWSQSHWMHTQKSGALNQAAHDHELL